MFSGLALAQDIFLPPPLMSAGCLLKRASEPAPSGRPLRPRRGPLRPRRGLCALGGLSPQPCPASASLWSHVALLSSLPFWTEYFFVFNFISSIWLSVSPFCYFLSVALEGTTRTLKLTAGHPELRSLRLAGDGRTPSIGLPLSAPCPSCPRGTHFPCTPLMIPRHDCFALEQGNLFQRTEEPRGAPFGPSAPVPCGGPPLSSGQVSTWHHLPPAFPVPRPLGSLLSASVAFKRLDFAFVF